MGDIDQLILLDRMKRIEQRKDDARALEFFLLHSDKININTQDSLGQTPLIIACKLGHEEVVQFLLGCPNLDVNIADDVYRNTALLTACSHGYEAIVSMLLGHKHIQVNRGDLGMDTPLMIACTMPHLGVVNLLLNNDELNINDQNVGGYTALMSILTEKDYADTEIVRSLLDHKDIDINFTLPQEYGYKNALTMACDIGQTEVISMLLQREEIHTTTGNLKAVTDFVMNYEDFLSGQAFDKLLIISFELGSTVLGLGLGIWHKGFDNYILPLLLHARAIHVEIIHSHGRCLESTSWHHFVNCQVQVQVAFFYRGTKRKRLKIPLTEK